MYPKAYIDYLVYFHVNFDYFECHEVLEEYWKKSPAEKRETIWVAFIQLAVGLYHERRDNTNGALKMLKRSAFLFEKQQATLESLAIDPNLLLSLINQRIIHIQTNTNTPFSPFSLPILQHDLLLLIEERREVLQIPWEKEGASHNSFIVHKHFLRDRTEVIEERELQLLKRRSN
ncbi:hypothetical protein BTS2_2275 [Bacillus sp. TS-2]|nr:hypothetical protein BTS2_2275 [Bacillus sp. TS-2]